MEDEELDKLLEDEGITLMDDLRLPDTLASNPYDISILPCRDEQPDWMDDEIYY